jgi:hypothetical protein
MEAGSRNRKKRGPPGDLYEGKNPSQMSLDERLPGISIPWLSINPCCPQKAPHPWKHREHRRYITPGGISFPWLTASSYRYRYQHLALSQLVAVGFLASRCFILLWQEGGCKDSH